MHRTALTVGVSLALLLAARPAEAGDARRVRLIETETGLARQVLDGRTVLSSVETPWPAPDEAWARANRDEILRLVLAGSRRKTPGRFQAIDPARVYEDPTVQPPPKRTPPVIALLLSNPLPRRHHVVIVPASFTPSRIGDEKVYLLIVATVAGQPGKLSCNGRLYLRWDGGILDFLDELEGRIITLTQGTFVRLGFHVQGGLSGEKFEIWSRWFIKVGDNGALADVGCCDPRFRATNRWETDKGHPQGDGTWWFEDLDGDGFEDLVVDRTDSWAPRYQEVTKDPPPAEHWVPCRWLDRRFRGAPPDGPGDVFPPFWSWGEIVD